MLGFEIDRDVIYFFCRYPSLVLLRLIVFLSMFVRFLFLLVFREPKTLQRYYKFLFRENLLKKLTGFNLSPALCYRRCGSFSKASAKLGTFYQSTKLFCIYFLPIFDTFTPLFLLINILTIEKFYVVKHIFIYYSI